MTLALLLNNKSPSRQNPRKKKQPLAEQQEEEDRRTRQKKQTEEQERRNKPSEKEYIFSGEETLSYGLKERSTRKKHRTTYNTKQNLTTKNNTYRLQREKIYSGKENAHLYTNSIQQERYNTHGYSVISSPGVKFNHRPHSILSA